MAAYGTSGGRSLGEPCRVRRPAECIGRLDVNSPKSGALFGTGGSRRAAGNDRRAACAPRNSDAHASWFFRLLFGARMAAGSDAGDPLRPLEVGVTKRSLVDWGVAKLEFGSERENFSLPEITRTTTMRG